MRLLRPTLAALLLVVCAAPSASALERLALSFDLLAEGGQLTGEQWINNTRRSERLEWSDTSPSMTAWGVFGLKASERLKWGPGVRLHGRLGDNYRFGLYGEAFAGIEYGLPVIEKFEVLFAGRGGLALLFPGDDFADEIARLQREGVGVWGLPRPGLHGSVGVGVRRRMSERIRLRLDLALQYSQVALFSHSEVIEDLRLEKDWGLKTLRFFLSLGAELSLSGDER